MKEQYTSVNQCLTDWEFCPLCGKRTNVDIDFREAVLGYTTTLTNNELKVVDDKLVYTINLKENTVLRNGNFWAPLLRICCKNFHWGIVYNIQTTPQHFVHLYLDKFSFFLKDNKTQIVYNLISNYIMNETIVTLSNDVAIFQEFKQELMDFSHFNKKYLIKKIRALCLLT